MDFVSEKEAQKVLNEIMNEPAVSIKDIQQEIESGHAMIKAIQIKNDRLSLKKEILSGVYKRCSKCNNIFNSVYRRKNCDTETTKDMCDDCAYKQIKDNNFKIFQDIIGATITNVAIGEAMDYDENDCFCITNKPLTVIQAIEITLPNGKKMLLDYYKDSLRVKVI